MMGLKFKYFFLLLDLQCIFDKKEGFNGYCEIDLCLLGVQMKGKDDFLNNGLLQLILVYCYLYCKCSYIGFIIMNMLIKIYDIGMVMKDCRQCNDKKKDIIT